MKISANNTMKSKILFLRALDAFVPNGSSTNMGPVQLGQAPLKAHCVPLAQVKVQFPPGQLSTPLEILLILTIHDPLMHHGSACWE